MIDGRNLSHVALSSQLVSTLLMLVKVLLSVVLFIYLFLYMLKSGCFYCTMGVLFSAYFQFIISIYDTYSGEMLWVLFLFIFVPVFVRKLVYKSFWRNYLQAHLLMFLST